MTSLIAVWAATRAAVSRCDDIVASGDSVSWRGHIAVGVLRRHVARLAKAEGPPRGGLRHRRLAYVGVVEYGFTRASIAELFERSRRLVHTTSPFTTAPHRAVVWLEPELLAEISYSELMDGWLRDPMFRGVINSRAR